MGGKRQSVHIARVDANQPEVVKKLRKAGYSVQHLHTIGQGCPDLLVAKSGVNVLVEVKQPGKDLTVDERIWREKWQGLVLIVYGGDDAVLKVAQEIDAALARRYNLN